MIFYRTKWRVSISVFVPQTGFSPPQTMTRQSLGWQRLDFGWLPRGSRRNRDGSAPTSTSLVHGLGRSCCALRRGEVQSNKAPAGSGVLYSTDRPVRTAEQLNKRDSRRGSRPYKVSREPTEYPCICKASCSCERARDAIQRRSGALRPGLGKWPQARIARF